MDTTSNSPEKENRPMALTYSNLPKKAKEDNILNSPSASMIIEPKTKADLVHNTKIIKCTVESLDLKASNNSELLNALGPAESIVEAVKTNLKLAFTLLKENDDVENGKRAPLESFDISFGICSASERLVSACSTLLSKLETGCMVTACFEILASALADLLNYSGKLKQHKFPVSELNELCFQILRKVQDLSTGPHDSSLLKAVEPFLIACFNSSAPKLRPTAVTMWNATFGNSKELEYSEKLRQTLAIVSKKASIFLPGLSVDLISSPSFKPSTPVQIRSTKKRIMALVDEDSVDYVPIAQTDSTKKMKLTEHQKEIFSAAREKIPFMEEDSQQFSSNVLSRISNQYDLESTSMSASVSTQPVLTKPSSPVSNNPVDNASETVSAKVEKEVYTITDEKPLPKRRGRPPRSLTKLETASSNSVSDSSNSNENGPTSRARRSLTMKAASLKKNNGDETKELLSSESNQEPASRRSLRIRPEKEEKKKSTKEEKSKELVRRETEEKLEKPNIESNMESEQSQDSSETTVTRSRRSRAQGTPSKYVPKKRVAKTLSEKKLSRKGKSPVATTVQQEEMENIKKEADSDDEPISLKKERLMREQESERKIEEQAVCPLLVTPMDEAQEEFVVLDSEDAHSPCAKEELNIQKSQKSEDSMKQTVTVEENIPMETQKESTPTKTFSPKNSVMTSVATTEKSEVVTDENSLRTPIKETTNEYKVVELSQENLQTPSKQQPNESTGIISAIRTTPGILKKIGTPTTQERKRLHVHFNQEVGIREEERNAIVATPKRGRIDSFLIRTPTSSIESATTSVLSTEPICPQLVQNNSPISKIIGRLTPIATQNSATFLGKQFAQKKVHTIGALAAASEVLISTLPVKLGTVKSVLDEYAESLKSRDVVISKPEPHSPSTQSLQMASDEMESEELKTIDDLQYKVEEEQIKVINSSNEVETTQSESQEVAAVSIAKSNNFESIQGEMNSMINFFSNKNLTTMDLTSSQVKELLASCQQISQQINYLQGTLLRKL